MFAPKKTGFAHAWSELTADILLHNRTPGKKQLVSTQILTVMTQSVTLMFVVVVIFIIFSIFGQIHPLMFVVVVIFMLIL